MSKDTFSLDKINKFIKAYNNLTPSEQQHVKETMPGRTPSQSPVPSSSVEEAAKESLKVFPNGTAGDSLYDMLQQARREGYETALAGHAHKEKGEGCGRCDGVNDVCESPSVQVLVEDKDVDLVQIIIDRLEQIAKRQVPNPFGVKNIAIETIEEVVKWIKELQETVKQFKQD